MAYKISEKLGKPCEFIVSNNGITRVLRNISRYLQKHRIVKKIKEIARHEKPSEEKVRKAKESKKRMKKPHNSGSY